VEKKRPASRREFMKASAAAGGALVIGFYLPSGIARTVAASRQPQPFAPNAFIRVSPDDIVTILCNKSEMGQGVFTALPMIAADEMDADWNRVRVEAAPASPAYFHTAFGIQVTGGSTSVNTSYEQLRKAGATARALLIAAGAATWKVDPESCRAERGYVLHELSGRNLSFGQLAAKAASLTPPTEVKLKNPKDFTLIGRPIHRLDSQAKVTGRAQFGIDVRIPGMLTAVIARPPVFGGKVMRVNADKAKAIPGVKQVVQIDTGVAVLADGFWPAKLGRDALEIDWDDGPLATLNSETQGQAYATLGKLEGSAAAVAAARGDVLAGFAKAETKLQAVYELPYLAHATMEPLNCVAHVKPDGVEVWTGTQMQTTDQMAAAQIAGVKPEKVVIRTMFLGGGFGRRANPAADFVKEAVKVSKAAGVPVKVVWTREDDMRGGYYRPRTYNVIRAGLDAVGLPVAWQHRIVGQSIIRGTPFEPVLMKAELDMTQVEGSADMQYDVPNFLVEYKIAPEGVPVLWWRSVGHSFTAFVKECFVDECAAAAKQDPVAYRRQLLLSHPRVRGVMDLAAEKAGWGRQLPPGSGMGVAVHESFGTLVAQVAEVSVAKSGEVTVNRVVCAIDCGPVVNPDTVRAQMESGIVFGLSAALYGEITFKDGRVQQSNFNDYPILRMDAMPRIEVFIVESSGPMGGVGEPGTPPIAPAVANAIFAATGKRVRKLPIDPNDIKPAARDERRSREVRLR
jgi:isoquinoline 1-oxidoreductase beta subunit